MDAPRRAPPSQLLANPLARAGNNAIGSAPGDGEDAKRLLVAAGPYAQTMLTTSIVLFKNTLDWMVGFDQLVPCMTALLPPSAAR